MPENKHELSIGEVAQATGVSVHTLRQWERRYGHPAPLKISSGHRRYSLKETTRLRLVAEALNLGHKANLTVPLSYSDLIQVLEQESHNSSVLAAEKWLDCVKSWDQEHLLEFCHKDWEALGPINFLQYRLTPFLNRIGESWALGEISIAQEHFFSELLQAFLATQWQNLNKDSSGDLYILATPEGEKHALGLHMCALVLALNKKKLLFLGTTTPFDEIISTVKKTGSNNVCLSLSAHYPEKRALADIKSLKKELGQSIQIILGGDGSPKSLTGTSQFSDLSVFSDWLRNRQKRVI